jgi:hypothetical protein
LEVPFLYTPMQGGEDLVGGYRIVFWSRLSGGSRFKGNGGGGRGRGRSHCKRKKDWVRCGCQWLKKEDD